MARVAGILIGMLLVSCQLTNHDGRVQVSTEACATCHMPEYEATTLPPHPGAFPLVCQSCHTIDAWVPATIVHDWPLDGGHDGPLCATCHDDEPPVYAGLSTECVSCHLPDYEGSAFPGHDAFPDTCQDCHTIQAWQPASFDHSWPLTGQHARTACLSCHVGTPPLYEGTPTLCIGCHQEDYDTSPFPGHSTFQTTCEDCHSTNAWTPAMGGNHPDGAFPIGGRHDYECAECHNLDLGSPVMGMNADCVGCHEGEHSRANADRDHSDVRDYPGAGAPPNFCLDCHPDGSN